MLSCDRSSPALKGSLLSLWSWARAFTISISAVLLMISKANAYLSNISMTYSLVMSMQLKWHQKGKKKCCDLKDMVAIWLKCME